MSEIFEVSTTSNVSYINGEEQIKILDYDAHVVVGYIM